MQKHRNTKHTEQMWSCEQCGEKFKTSIELKHTLLSNTPLIVRQCQEVLHLWMVKINLALYSVSLLDLGDVCDNRNKDFQCFFKANNPNKDFQCFFQTQ